jgi:hypothetical protein
MEFVMSEPLHLVQICNVGSITGGTGACARTVVQALPDWNHTLLVFGRISDEMRTHCRPHTVRQISRVTGQLLQELRPDGLVFHNTRRDHVRDECLRWPAIYYQHSNGPRWEGIKTLACSRWLSDQQDSIEECEVLYQAVPRAARSSDDRRRAVLSRDLTVGRLCTPANRKWPRELISFYAELAEKHQEVRWEFVGCPLSLRAELKEAVRGRAVFHEACWNARSHYWNWDVSLYHHPTLTESFGRTVAEAMRSSCIPVVDDRGGFREQLPDGTGCLCSSIKDFSCAIAKLSDPAERLRRSRRCRAHADDHFSIHAFRERLLQVFRQTIANH